MRIFFKPRYGDQDYAYADPEIPYQEEYTGGSFQMLINIAGIS